MKTLYISDNSCDGMEKDFAGWVRDNHPEFDRVEIRLGPSMIWDDDEGEIELPFRNLVNELWEEFNG